MQDTSIRTEEVIRRLGECGSGSALARVICALARPWDVKFAFNELEVLDIENRKLATDLIADWLSGSQTYGDWARLEALARECSHLIDFKEESSE